MKNQTLLTIESQDSKSPGKQNCDEKLTPTANHADFIGNKPSNLQI